MANTIDPTLAETLRRESEQTKDDPYPEGARGSHLEILERNEGYKGFNQSCINDIILRTDPRRT